MNSITKKSLLANVVPVVVSPSKIFCPSPPDKFALEMPTKSGLSPDGTTNYLSEVETGSEVLILNSKGKARRATVGRTNGEVARTVFAQS